MFFKGLAIAVLAYTLHAVSRGRVYARFGLWGRTIARETEPRYFWVVVAIYAGLSLALFFLF